MYIQEPSPRAKVFEGMANWPAIIREEASGQHIKRVQDETSRRGSMIITGNQRDTLLRLSS